MFLEKAEVQTSDRCEDNTPDRSIKGVESSGEQENGDYSGAVAKTDQDEINLVRKMDFRIMPTLWAMYFL